MNLPVSKVKIIWILAQGSFLPLVLFWNDLREAGNLFQWAVFALLEGLYMWDAIMFYRIFKGGK